MTNPRPRQLTGKLDSDRVRPRPNSVSANVLERFRRLTDLTSTVSDVLDEMEIRGVLPTSQFSCTMQDASIVGPAITVHNIAHRDDAYQLAARHLSHLAEIEAHNLARPGDVIVIQGVPGVSNMGGISSTIAKRQGELGAIIEGGTRDIGHSRELQFPIWATEVTPITGKWRAETIAVNGDIEVGGVRVSAGDIVVADGTGVCFIPLAAASNVIARAEAIAAGEAQRHKDIDAGLSVIELANRTYVYQFASDAESLPRSPDGGPHR